MFNYVDLFAGCGGLSLGIERAGGSLQLAVEKSDMAARTFHVNFVNSKMVDDASWSEYLSLSPAEQARQRVAVQPLRSILDDELTMAYLIQQGVDVVVGGPPCQGFSLAGRRNPEDVRNKLPWEYLEFVERTNPKLVVIENVVGMNHRFSSDEEPPFVQLQQALRETGPGYVVQGVAVNALHYGAPQNRPRLMIIGLRKDVAEATGITAAPTIWTSSYSDELATIPLLAPRPRVTREGSPTVADAIGDLQMPQPRRVGAPARAFRAMTRTKKDWGLTATTPKGPIPNQTPRAHSADTQRRFRLYQWLRENSLQARTLSQHKPGDDSARAELRLKLADCEFPALSPDGTLIADDVDEMIDVIESLRTRKHSQKALSWDFPARTVVTLPDDYVHPSEPRIFTVREMARFQGFPDDFVFIGKETTGSTRRRFEVPQYSQVGNAVSPFLALGVGEMIADVMGKYSSAAAENSRFSATG